MKMKDVAERAGVSLTTVSRVLNGSQIVQPEYRERVLHAIAELEYKPNRLASNLRRQKAEMLGVVISDVADPHFAQLLRAVEDCAYRQGYRVLLCNTDETVEKQSVYLEILLAERVSGVLISPIDPDDPQISKLLDIGIPVIALDRMVHDPRADAILVNNFAAAQQATQHLIEQGHTRITLIAGTPTLQTGAERAAGYEQAMRAAHLEPSILGERFTAERGEAVTELLLGASPAPTALVIANNLLAIGVLRALHRHHCLVPAEMALVVIDDPFWVSLVNPPLTALAHPVQRMAQCAVELLQERIHGKRSEPKRNTFDFELHVRDSSLSKPLQPPV
jgi:DNA-binding LacI/PurR family transcriptional regulator